MASAQSCGEVETGTFPQSAGRGRIDSSQKWELLPLCAVCGSHKSHQGAAKGSQDRMQPEVGSEHPGECKPEGSEPASGVGRGSRDTPTHPCSDLFSELLSFLHGFLSMDHFLILREHFHWLIPFVHCFSSVELRCEQQ